VHRWILAAAALAVLGAPAAAQNTDALDLVPDDALGYILVKDLRRFSDKVESFAKKLGAEERVSLLELIQNEVGIRDGLNDKGSAVFIVLDGKVDESSTVELFAVAVTDFGKVAQQLGVEQPKDGINEGQVGTQSGLLAAVGYEPVDAKATKAPALFAKRGEFVVLAPPKHREALTRVLGSRKSIAASVQPARGWLDEQDVSGVCTHNGVKKVELLMMGAGVASSTPGQAQRMKETFAEVEKNVKLVAFGGRIEEAGHWRLATRVHFDPEGSYAKWIAKAQPADGKVLAELPDRPYLLAGLARVSTQTSFEDAIRHLTDTLPADAADRLTKNAVQLVQRISEVGLAVYADPGEKKGAPGEDGLLDRMEVGLRARVDDAPAVIAGAVELLKQARAASKEKHKDEVTFQQKELAGRPSWLIRWAGKGEPKDGKPSSPEKPAELVLVLTELNAQTVFASVLWDADRAEAVVKKLAAGSGQPLTKNPGLQKSAALLPEKLQLAVHVNVQPLGRLAGFTVTDCPPVGFALHALPAGIEAQFVLPFETLQAVFKAVNAKKEHEPKEK
jgi:hypothetical protein